MTKYLIATMPDNTRWRIPARFIAEHRARYYVKHDHSSDFDDEVTFCLADDYEITDWASNNMNWSDVITVAEKLPAPELKCDHHRCWTNAYMEVVTTRLQVSK